MSVLERYARSSGDGGNRTWSITIPSSTADAFERRVEQLGLTVSEAVAYLIQEELQAPARPKDRGELYREFWEALLLRLGRRHKPLKQSWHSFAAGYRGLSYALCFARGQKVRVELYIDTEDAGENSRMFRALEAQRRDLERGLGVGLTFEPMDGRRACRIALYRPGTIDDAWEPLIDWMVEWLPRFEETFSTAIKSL